jgi:hypothetical protein
MFQKAEHNRGCCVWSLDNERYHSHEELAFESSMQMKAGPINIPSLLFLPLNNWSLEISATFNIFIYLAFPFSLRLSVFENNLVFFRKAIVFSPV